MSTRTQRGSHARTKRVSQEDECEHASKEGECEHANQEGEPKG